MDSSIHLVFFGRGINFKNSDSSIFPLYNNTGTHTVRKDEFEAVVFSGSASPDSFQDTIHVLGGRHTANIAAAQIRQKTIARRLSEGV